MSKVCLFVERVEISTKAWAYVHTPADSSIITNAVKVAAVEITYSKV